MDWAALAQQWIKMKETVVPPAPPPPAINPICPGNDGSGEAPMDMDTKDDDVPPAPPAPNISGSGERVCNIDNISWLKYDKHLLQIPAYEKQMLIRLIREIILLLQ